jgi:DNA-nicking Smr family endonuclease
MNFYQPTPTIDLHMKTLSESVALLEKKLPFHKLNGDFCIIVIHGRGIHGKKGIDEGKLKSRIPDLLAGPKFAKLVDRVEKIPENPGGVLVFLK